MHGVNPYAIKVMAEKGIDISHNKSKLIDEDYLRSCDYVVTLCGDAMQGISALILQIV